jgi:hypothetical protein
LDKKSGLRFTFYARNKTEVEPRDDACVFDRSAAVSGIFLFDSLEFDIGQGYTGRGDSQVLDAAAGLGIQGIRPATG